MATFDLGRVTPLYKGDYSALASYELNDVVLYNGNLYWHVQATATVGILPTDTTAWKLVFTDEGVRAEIRGYADNAQNSASSAQASRTAVAQSASQASESATQASTYATNASASATEASASATNAEASATQAQEYAEQAEESAEHFVLDTKLIKDSTNGVENQAIYPLLGAFPTDTATGAIASFTDGADGLPLKSLVVGIEPKQSGSGDPSPTNVRPISGWTGAEVTKAGKNLFDKTDVEPGALIAEGTVQQSGKTKCVSGFIKINPNTTYYLANIVPATDGRSGFWYDADKNPIEVIIYNPYTVTSFPTTSPSNAEYMRIGCYVTSVDTVQVELGSTPTAYSPYTSDTIPITFPSAAGTVYGGSLDVTNGVLAVTKGFIASYSGQTLPGTWISDRDVYAQGATPTTGAEVCYDLATPITYQLTPTEVKSLLGVNNIWTDTGDTNVVYRADTSAYIAKKIAEAISALS